MERGPDNAAEVMLECLQDNLFPPLYCRQIYRLITFQENMLPEAPEPCWLRVLLSC